MRPKKIGQSGEVGGFWKVWRFHQAGRTASFLDCWRFCCCLPGRAAACWCRSAWRLSGFAQLVLLGRQSTWIVDFLMSELLLYCWHELLKMLKRAKVSVLFGTEMRTLALRCPELVNFYIFYMNSFLSIPLCTSFLEFAQRFSGWFETGRFGFFWLFCWSSLLWFVLMCALRGLIWHKVVGSVNLSCCRNETYLGHCPSNLYFKCNP